MARLIKRYYTRLTLLAIIVNVENKATRVRDFAQIAV